MKKSLMRFLLKLHYAFAQETQIDFDVYPEVWNKD